jgi:hypothetical protein
MRFLEITRFNILPLCAQIGGYILTRESFQQLKGITWLTRQIITVDSSVIRYDTQKMLSLDDTGNTFTLHA